MRRFSVDDNPRQRKRHATSTTASGFLTNITAPKSSASTFLTPQKVPARPFIFSCVQPSPYSTTGVRAWAQVAPGGQSIMLNGVIAGLGAEKLAEAFKKPFHGVSLDHADIASAFSNSSYQNSISLHTDPGATTQTGTSIYTSELFHEGDQDIPSTPAKPAEPSISQRIRKLWNVCKAPALYTSHVDLL